MAPPTLRTERLILDAYTPEDEESFVALFQDERVSRWMGDGPEPEADTRALFWRVFTKVYAHSLFDVWAVRMGESFVGHAELKRRVDRTEVVDGYEIIYAMAPHVWGCGLGTEVAEAIVGHGFSSLGLTEVHATVAAGNERSLALLRKIGFEHVRDVVSDVDGEVAGGGGRAAAGDAGGPVGGVTRVLTRRLA